MISLREPMKEVVDKLLDDVREDRIFNEADMQYRAAHHLDKVCYPELYLTNQPVIPVGQRRGKKTVKPDIVIFDEKRGPYAAVELKCFIGSKAPSFAAIVNPVWSDIEKLEDFRARYPDSKNAFAIVLVDLEDRELFRDIQNEFSRTNRETWMTHYLFIHLVNLYCKDDGRKRPWYDKWSAVRQAWQGYFSEL